ncbi:UNVERIFIED_CONTAM: Germin-like protein subfamily 3 member 2 [Sesamum latifolium]|uniref:Germin-like protein subfamily 3 member 2 n=1 Tax=Sesamum latifolium TaxID=2727402 RepID=A0AAW2U364_9LAMI
MYLKFAFLLLLFCFFALRTWASDPDPVQDFCIPNTNFDASVGVPCKNPRLVTPDDFVFSGIKSPGNFSDTGLSAVPVNPTTFPGLNTLGMSFVRADFRPGGINPPHFHPRATETVYVIQGKVYAGFVDSTNRVFAKKIPNVIFGSGINDELLEKAFGLSLRQISTMRRRFLPRKG